MILKNINHATVMSLKDQVAYQEGQIVSKTLVQSMSVGITLFSFWKGEFISTHESNGDAFVVCLDGVSYILKEGEAIVMPANHPHAVYGEDNFKMMLTVVFPQLNLKK